MIYQIANLFLLLLLLIPFTNSTPTPYTIISDPKNVLLEYDYIVVGGGTSGLVVASRLSDNRSTFRFPSLYPTYHNPPSSISLLALYPHPYISPIQ
jgi:hypothetical protein